MEKEFIHQLEEVMPRLEELVKYKRYVPGFGFFCKARDVGLDSYVECLQKDSHDCPFSMSHTGHYYCTSSARIYFAKIRRMNWNHLP